jgi:hypothetical protein
MFQQPVAIVEDKANKIQQQERLDFTPTLHQAQQEANLSFLSDDQAARDAQAEIFGVASPHAITPREIEFSSPEATRQAEEEIFGTSHHDASSQHIESRQIKSAQEQGATEYSSLIVPSKDFDRDIAYPLPNEHKTIVPEEFKAYAESAKEYLYTELNGTKALITATDTKDATGKAYTIYASHVFTGSNSKPDVSVVVTNNPRDMFRASALVAQEYFNTRDSKGILEARFAETNPKLMGSGIPTIGDIINLQSYDQADYKDIVQFAEGKTSYDGMLENIKERYRDYETPQFIILPDDGETHAFKTNGDVSDFDSQNGKQHGTTDCQKISSIKQPSAFKLKFPSYSRFDQQFFQEGIDPFVEPSKNHGILSASMSTGGQYSYVRSACMAAQEKEPVHLKINIKGRKSICLQYIKNAEKLLHDYKLICNGDLKYLSTPLLQDFLAKYHFISSSIDNVQIPHKEKADLLEKQKELERIIKQCETIMNSRIKLLLEYKQAIIFYNTSELQKIEKNLNEQKTKFDQHIWKESSDCQDLFSNYKAVETQIASYYLSDAAIERLRKQFTETRIKLSEASKIYSQNMIDYETISIKLNLIRDQIQLNECRINKLLTSRIPELNKLKAQYADPKNSFELELAKAINGTLENKEIVVTRLALSQKFCDFITSMGSKPEVFGNRADSQLGFYINQYCISTLDSVHSHNQNIGCYYFPAKIIKTVVNGCTDAAKYAQIGEYTKSIKILAETRSLAIAINALSKSGLVDYTQRDSQEILRRKAGEYLLAKYLQEICSDFSMFKNEPGSAFANLQTGITVATRIQGERSLANLIDDCRSRYEQFLAEIAKQNSLPQLDAQSAQLVDIQSAVDQTASAHLTEHAAQESCIFLDESDPYKEGPILEFVSTAANHFSECNKGKNELACKILTQLAPAVGKGIAKGLINSANPFNALLVPYYKIKLAADVSGFALQETYNFAQYVQYKLSGQQANADKMLAMCAEPFKKIAATWDTLDDAAKFEMASQIFTEIIAGGKVSQICDRFKKTVLEKAGTLTSNPTITKALKVISDFDTQKLMPGIVDSKQIQILKDKATKLLTSDTLKELRCEISDLAQKYGLNLKELNENIEKAFNGLKDITHLKRLFHVNGVNIEMKTGHSYYRQHLKGGDLRTICSLNEIENAVMEKVLLKENLDILTTENHFIKTFDFMGKTIEYEVNKIPGLDLISIDYYPTN